MDWVTGVVIATVGVFIFAAILSALVYVRQPAAAEYGVFAALSCFLAAHSLASLSARADDVAGGTLAGCALIVAFAMTAHFAVRAEPMLHGSRWLALTYGVAAALLALCVSGRAAAACSVGAHLYGFAAAAGLLHVMAAAYLAGKRESVGVLVGAGVLLVTLLNDGARAAGFVATGELAPIGYIVLALGVAARRTSEDAKMRRELEVKKVELKTRGKELRRSYNDLRAMQEQLAKSEQLAVVGELAAVIAHEVRNPLAIISNAVSSLRKENLAKEDHVTLLGIVDDETSRLNRIVSDLLRFARPVTVQRSTLKLNELLERALSLAYKERGLKVDFEINMPDALISGDSNLLRQVFDNLIDNAVQAMGSDGTLTVRIRPSSDGDGVAVDIIDTGEGMDTAVRMRAKDPFFTTRPAGTGLGLAIVDRIVEAHEGTLVIESRPGEGTRVTVHLPNVGPIEPAQVLP